MILEKTQKDIWKNLTLGEERNLKKKVSGTTLYTLTVNHCWKYVEWKKWWRQKCLGVRRSTKRIVTVWSRNSGRSCSRGGGGGWEGAEEAYKCRYVFSPLTSIFRNGHLFCRWKCKMIYKHQRIKALREHKYFTMDSSARSHWRNKIFTEKTSVQFYSLFCQVIILPLPVLIE